MQAGAVDRRKRNSKCGAAKTDASRHAERRSHEVHVPSEQRAGASDGMDLSASMLTHFGEGAERHPVQQREP